MKKVLFLIPLFLLPLMANATTWNIGPTNPQTSDNIRRTMRDNVSAGDVIVLADGTYTESDVILFDKSVTVKAAEGAHPVIAQHYYSKITSGADVKFIGVKFDGSLYNNGAGANDHCFYPYDLTAGNELHFENCEFTGFKSYVLYNGGAYTLDSLIINNCYFHNNTKSSVIFFNKHTGEGAQSVKGVIVTNSTFANNATTPDYSVIAVHNKTESIVEDVEIKVDHCTFYNNPTKSTDHSCIRSYKSKKVTVSNCIFAHPSSIEYRATCLYGGSISNCLTYNLTKDASNNAHRLEVWEAPTDPLLTGNFTANPLFTDAASGDYSYDGNWETMSLSPARGAGTDGSDLGDPRWYSAEVLPSTSFASAYDLLGNKALLNGNIELNASNRIKYKGSKVAGTAKWKLHITKACAISAIADRESGSTSGCTLTLTVYDADGNEVDAATASRSDDDNDINIGNLYIPEEGDYTIVLSNSVEYSGSILEKITLSYLGGAVQNIASATNTTVDVSEAWYSAGGTRSDGKISFPGSLIETSWIRWNVHVVDSKYYDITVNFESDNGHNLGVRLFNDERSIEISEGGQTSATSPRELGRLSIPAGDYTMEVTNPVSHSHAQLISVLFAPVVASATELPGTLEFGNAVLSDRAHVTAGNLYFAPIGDTNPAGEWASWAVTTDHNGTFLFTLGANSDNGHSYKIYIYDEGDNLIDSFEKKLSSGAAGTIKHYFELASGNYSVKVENTTAWSHGYLTSFAVTEPSLLTLSETDESNTTISTNYRQGAKDIRIIRTITAGMYNTICLPFDVSSSALKEIFGDDVELLQMESATIDGTVLDLNFENVTSIYRGTPYLIKTTKTIANPIFVDVEIKVEEGDATDGVAADFIGTFIKTTIEESPNNLFLGANNMLYFPQGGDMPIKGMRAYFTVNSSSDAPVRQARIVMQGNVVTELELALPEFTGKAQKRIENGQLIVILNGVQYNALGVREK